MCRRRNGGTLSTEEEWGDSDFFFKQIKKVKNYSSCFDLIASSIRSWHGKKSDLGHSTTASQQAVQISSTSKQKYF